MNPLQTRRLTRQQIGDFVTSPRGIRAFEDAQIDITSQNEALTTATFLTLTDSPSLGSERIFSLASGDLVGFDSGPNSAYTVSLDTTGVSDGSYGSSSETLSFTVDSKGRLLTVQAYDLNTDNIFEGSSNLYFTTARARASLSATTGVTYNNATGVIGLDGSQHVTTRTVTSAPTIAATDYLLLVDATASSITVSLPAAAISAGRVLCVKKIDSSVNSVTLDGNASETIDGAATLVIALQWGKATIACDGVAWFVI